MRKVLHSLGVEKQYSYEKPKKPQNPIYFSTAANAKKILGDPKLFNVVWGDAISSLTGGVNYMLSGDRPSNFTQHIAVSKAVYSDVPQGMDEVWEFYTKFTEKLLEERSYRLDNVMQVDAVRE